MQAMRALAAILVLSAGLVQVTAAAKPLKVFILAGQSNMEGQAVVDLEGKDYNEGRGTLVQLMRDPAKAPMLQHLKSAEGQWVTRDDVWVRYQRERGPLLAGPLTFGFSVYGDRHHFGPELQFGHVIGDRLENQVLLIKTAWGGKSLYTDFRPPSSGGEVGKYFTLMLAQVREALANLETDFPGYDGGGYELAGFVWYHGWNDGVNPKTAVPAYETNLVNLIHDVRKELNAPRLPVVIGELTGPWVKAPVEWTKLRQAQAAAAARPEFKGNVLYVETHEFVRKPEESPNPGHGHHEFGNAETYFLVGDALGKGMLSLLRGQTAARHQTNTIEGWTVLVNERLPAEDQAATAKALELLRVQLQEIVRAVPAPAVAKLREVTLWFSPEYPGVKPRAEYHPGAGWLRDNGRDPAMVKGVEFTDVRNFEAETKRMPNFTLHELAHAYHDRVLPKGFANPDIQAAFERAKAGKSYDRVERWFGNGRPNTMEKAYAMNSPMEYFAETTEAFFSRNDFFPFTRAELKQHDPEMEQLLARLWAAASPSAGTVTVAPEKSLPPYRRMDFGPALFWTLQVAPGNIAQKGIAIRLDDGPGGVSKGRAWMTYDHDTMRVAAATTGDFVDWKGIAFDGSHGTHTGLSGERHFVNPVGPGWASPDGKWEDERLVGRDQRRYGPLPREWAHYEGMYLHGGKAVIAANIGGTRVLESPGWIDSAPPVFTRTLNLGAAKKPLLLRVAPDSINVALSGTGSLRKEGGFWIAELSGGAKARLFISRTDAAALEALARTFTASLDLEALTHGGPPRWPQRVTTTSEPGKADGAFIADTFPLPVENPWQSWMRPGGFDFAPDGKAAVVATWNGDVWRVDGLMAAAPSPLSWRRIASGLFQPLGVKFRGDELFITCRDQLVRLRDLNGDGETDFIENFNNDHQVTEHFHEFAMGLQTDSVGNFYYAKSGRHALDSVVPHHGTLLRVRADGLRTDILATGFRAANGVCLNDDGTFFVTDQEGFWTPKNRINRVKVGGFYGNMFGYTAVTNTSDAAMEQPMVWITNAKDRSPAELIWVPENAWGSLGGSLLNLSYGTGRAFIVPHEAAGGQWQGAVCELPMPAFATGIMRGRFAEDGALYACGLFGWAGNAAAPGGFHRIRRNEKPAHVPLAIHAAKGALSVTFSESIDPASVQPDAFAFKVWSLKRSANYGSKHYDEHPVGIEAARPGADARTVTLDIPMLAPTQCYELRVRLLAPDGASIDRSLHGTIHRLSEK